MNPDASIVVVLPAYNAARTLEKTYADIPVQARNFPEASSVNFKVSTIYGLKTVGVMVRFLLQRLGLMRFRFFDRKLTDVVRRYHHGTIFREWQGYLSWR